MGTQVVAQAGTQVYGDTGCDPGSEAGEDGTKERTMVADLGLTRSVGDYAAVDRVVQSFGGGLATQVIGGGAWLRDTAQV